MKLHPPTLAIDENDPFKAALFGRKEFALSLTNLLRHSEDNVVLFVSATWGEGKTTFTRMWRSHLRGEKLEAIYYDAYASDYFADPFVSFSGEILALVRKRLSSAKGAPESREAFKKAAVEIAKRLAGLGAKVAVKAATLGAIDAADFKPVADFAADVAAGTSEIAGDIVEQRIEHYTAEKDTLVAFKASLAKLAKMVRDEQGFPLTIIVDELDRCRPDFALGLLERIKHLFDVPNLAFALFVNRPQIERYVEAVYGKGSEGADYLLKFGNLFVDLPTSDAASGRHEVGRGEYCQQLFTHFAIPFAGDDRRYTPQLVPFCAEHFALTLRQIENVFRVLALYYGAGGHPHADPITVSTLATLKVARPELYRRLSRMEASANEFYDATGFDSLEEHAAGEISSGYIRDVFNYYLFTAEEFKNLPEPKRVELERWLGGGSRRKLIPKFCAALDRLSFKPTKL